MEFTKAEIIRIYVQAVMKKLNCTEETALRITKSIIKGKN